MGDDDKCVKCAHRTGCDFLFGCWFAGVHAFFSDQQQVMGINLGVRSDPHKHPPHQMSGARPLEHRQSRLNFGTSQELLRYLFDRSNAVAAPRSRVCVRVCVPTRMFMYRVIE